MFIASLLSGYFLVLEYANKAIVIPSEYVNKETCEKAANIAASVRWFTVCIPTDTHTANEEFD